MSRLLVHLLNYSFSYGSRLLFDDISLSIGQGEIFALIGENGSGKTTLLQLIADNAQSDVGYLPQEVVVTSPDTTVRDYIQEGRLRELERQMASCLENGKIGEWELLHEEYESLGGYSQVPVEEVLQGLKLDCEACMGTLSSGERVRVSLAKALIANPDLLLLDEPTNHLDDGMVKWLQDLLQKRKGATVIVSHDRSFLRATVNRLLELKDGKLSRYGGGYDYYLEEQERRLAAQLKAYEEQQEEKASLQQKIKAMTFSKKKTTPCKDRNVMAYDRRGEYFQRSQQHILDMLKLRLDEIERDPLPHPKPKSITGLKFATTPLASNDVIELEGLSKAYGDKVLFSDLTCEVKRGDRIVITGPNGAGKTTLLRCIMGLESVDAGTIHLARSSKIAYLDQEVSDLQERTPFEYFNLSEEKLLRELHMAAIGGSELIHLPFSKLSIGQKKRFYLLKLILERPNILLLDEPTNHLDLLTLEAFEKALLDFEGAIIAVSHDQTFISKIATSIWRLPLFA